ncbi:tetratricopeptide repeat protein [Aeromonas hydrophila]|uniref:tetratricopeptide repeat protein n=1 Tax=Aeromonas hydrophila TaxID=644 RepID=UPI0038D0B2A5
MSTSSEPSIEERKLTIETKKLALAKRSYYVDLISKVTLPAVLAALAWVTYTTNTKAVEERMTFDFSAKRTELRQKEDELFLKKSESERNKESLKTAFIQRQFTHITSSSADEQKQIEVLARAVFPAAEVQEVLAKITMIRESSPRLVESPATTNEEPSADDYTRRGKQYVKADRYTEAAQQFATATILAPTDAAAWNYKAYSEMRGGSLDAALKSIGTSIRLRPDDPTLQRNVMLNATKILCSLGQMDDAASYFNKSVAAFPNLLASAKADDELKGRCGNALTI